MRTLDLRLKGVYYDLIKAGKKKKEYRKIDDYYIGRLIGGVDVKNMSPNSSRSLSKSLGIRQSVMSI